MTPDYMKDCQEAIDWSKEILQTGCLILDTETTGLGSDAEIVQIAVIDHLGTVLLDTLVKPFFAIPRDASRIHGIYAEHVANAPTCADIWPQLDRLLSGSRVVIYNADYDMRILRQCSEIWNLPRLAVKDTECAMLRYSAFVGDWNDYHGNYRWQRLDGGDHSALGDCLATLKTIQKMAGTILVPGSYR